MRRLELHGVVVTDIETTSADRDNIVSFRHQHVGTSERAKLRMMYPGAGILVFGLTVDVFEIDLKSGETVCVRMSHRRNLSQSKILEYPIRPFLVAPVLSFKQILR